MPDIPNVTPAELLKHVRLIGNAQREYDEAHVAAKSKQGVYRAAYKAAKKAGIDEAALAECRRQVAGGIERLVAPAGETAGRGPDRRRRLADGLVAEVLRRAAAGEKATAIAVALGVKPKQVENLIARRRQSIAPPAAPPAAARTRQQPPTAADIEAAQAAQAALRAPADAIAIRSWAEANGLRLPPGDGLDRACLQVVNAARVRHGLTPFWLLAHRQGALPADELRRMRAAGAVPTLPPEPGDRSRGRASNFYGAKAPR